jgi:hypothetical protein
MTQQQVKEFKYKQVIRIFNQEADRIDKEAYPHSEMLWEVHRSQRATKACFLAGDDDIYEIRQAFYAAKTTNDLRNLALQVATLLTNMKTTNAVTPS